MKEYIDKKDAINLLWLFADETCASVVWDFENLPAQDVVEVVRCKDCKWWEKGKDYTPYCNHPVDGLFIAENDFCSYGKRRDRDKR